MASLQSQHSIIEKLLTKGKTQADIGRQLGVTRAAISYYVRNEPSLFKLFQRNSALALAATQTRRAAIKADKHAEVVSRKGHDLGVGENIRQRRCLTRKKVNARSKGIEFSIRYCDLDFPTHCPALGIKLRYDNKRIADNSPSFDRINPKKGYVKGNVVIVSVRANRIKQNASSKELFRVARFVKSIGR